MASLQDRVDWPAVATWTRDHVLLAMVCAAAAGVSVFSKPAGADVLPLGHIHWPAGVALAACMRYGLGVWPIVALGLVLGNLAMQGLSWFAALGVAAVDVSAAAGAAWLLKRQGVEMASPLRMDLLYLLIAGFAAAALAGAITSLLVPHAGGWAMGAGAHVLAWALAALLLVGPFGAGTPHTLNWPAAIPAGVMALLGVLAARQWIPNAQAWNTVMAQWLVAAVLAAMTLGMLVWLGRRARDPAPWAGLFDSARMGIASWSVDGHDPYTSNRWRSLLGDDQGRRTVGTTGLVAAAHEDDRQALQMAMDTLDTPGNDQVKLELRMMSKKGWRWIELCAQVPSRRADGVPARVVVSLDDVTERRTAADRENLSANLFQHLHEGLLITDAQMRVLDVNPTYLKITGQDREELIGKIPPLLQGSSSDGASRVQHAAMWSGLQTLGTWRGELAEVRRNGEPCILQVTISTVRGPDTQARYHVLVISDITDQRRQRDRLERQAHYDELTRLPNRAHLAQLLAEGMRATERDNCLLAVCYLDLDHFKPVNDQHGHAAGDRLLVELARRLRSALRSHPVWSDRAARLGGDEFALLLRASSVEEVRLAVERVLRVASLPYVVDDESAPVAVTASIGATIYPIDRSDPDTLLRHADHAMYGAKQTGRNRYMLFDPEHDRRTEERVVAIGRLEEALLNNELVLHYQPKVDMRRGVVVGVEALLRWSHPSEGLIAPGMFLPLIETTGLSARVGDWVLDQSLNQMAMWQAQGLDMAVSVNVSARHLQEPDFATRLAELLNKRPGLTGRMLELEVLETTALVDVAHTSSLLDRCRALGVRFALDDFGTGYSTLSYLKRLPVDVLKIDRSFVHNMLEDTQDLAIVEGVIGLARTFHCTVIAEGVENAAQARTLLDLGCDVGQGHGIAMPMSADQVPDWVRNYKGPFALTPTLNPGVMANHATDELASGTQFKDDQKSRLPNA
jgi:diguanylate cyclase (GGDEF)-like protein/PAS domain S-box-containing protein